jgi:hypothetical protein
MSDLTASLQSVYLLMREGEHADLMLHPISMVTDEFNVTFIHTFRRQRTLVNWYIPFGVHS